jgi:pyroglutamyl-peptidase
LARKLRTILVTGFEPFGPIRVNPSETIARAFDGRRIRGARIVGRVLPVSLGRIGPAVAAALRETRPDAVVALGVARNALSLRIERRAVNRARFEIPDNDGALAATRLETAGRPMRRATLPLDRIMRAARRSRTPVRYSDDAGAYLCNAAFYAFLGARTPCAFLHVPMHDALRVRRALERVLASCAGGRAPSG